MTSDSYFGRILAAAPRRSTYRFVIMKPPLSNVKPVILFETDQCAGACQRLSWCLSVSLSRGIQRNPPSIRLARPKAHLSSRVMCLVHAWSSLLLLASSVASLAPSAAVGHRLNGERKPRTLWFLQNAATALEDQEHQSRRPKAHPIPRVTCSVVS
jgi:hypothetical protein